MPKTFYSVQALRGFGALLVVVFHAFAMVRAHLDPTQAAFAAGAAGVDLFFAISGFIMIITTRSYWGTPGAARIFLQRRLQRVVPLYWCITTVKLAILAVGGSFALSWWHSIASYLFIPAWNPDHKPYPLLIPGWTLAFEMLFYLAFAGMLALKRPPLPSLALLFAALAAIGSLFGPFDWAILTLLDQRLLEFVMGMGIAMLVLAGRNIPAPMAYALAPLSLVFLYYSNGMSSHMMEHYVLLIWGIPSAVLLYACVALEHRKFWQLPLLRHLGDASYAIYLTHEFAISAVKVVVTKLALPLPVTTAVVLSVIAASIGGYLVHRWLEQPLLRIVKTV